MNLIGKGISGIKWVSISRVLRHVLQFITLIILANLLSPSDFGLIGMAMVVIGFLNVFRDLGISAALIQTKNVSDNLFSSVFWVNISFGLLLTLAVIIASPLISNFYNEDRLTPIIKFLSLGFLITSITILHQAVLERELHFSIIAKYEIVSTLGGSITGIILAFLNFGVWSLVFQSIITIIINSFFLWIYSPKKPKFIFKWDEVKSVARFSLNLSGFNLVNYAVRNADYLIIGKYLGALELGYYTLAYRIMLYPVENIAAIVSRVLFPIYSKIKNDNKQFKEIFIKAANSIALLTFPLMLGVLVLSDTFIHTFFDVRWDPVILLLIIFSPVGLMQSIYTTSGSIFQAKGRTDIWFRWGLLTAVLFISGFFIGIKWGIIGVAMSYLIVNIITFYPGFAIPFKLINLTVAHFLKSFSRTFIAALIMLLVLFFFKILLKDLIAPKLMFGLLILVGISIYLAVSLLINKKKIYRVWELLTGSKT